MVAEPRRFRLVRYVDLSGVSGTGPVAEGCLFSDGTAALHWPGEHPATTSWPTGIASVLAVHGHNGSTVVEWLDPEPIAEPLPTAPTEPDALGRAARALDVLCHGTGIHPPEPPQSRTGPAIPDGPPELGDVRGR